MKLTKVIYQFGNNQQYDYYILDRKENAIEKDIDENSLAYKLGSKGKVKISNYGQIIFGAFDVLLEKRKKEYSAKGVDYYQPWLVVMTDGYPDSTPVSSINRVKQLGSNKKLTVFSVAIGDGADKTILKQFSTIKDGMVFKVKSPEHFKEYFEWLSQSVLVASQSVPGDKPRLPQPSTVIEIEL